MELRRLQHIKGGSFTLSLPKRWVEKRELKQSEKIVVLEEEDGSLRLYPAEMIHAETAGVVLNLQDFPEIRTLEYWIETYYIQGSSRIIVKSERMIPADLKRKLKLFRLDLPGLEVVEEESNAISFQVLVDPAAFLLESLIEKTSSFSLHLQEDAVRSIVQNDSQLASEVVERSKEALRHYKMTIRQVALASFNKTIARKVGIKNCRECVTFALTARDLNRLIYHSSSIAVQYLALKDKATINHEISLAIEDLSRIAHSMQKDAVKAFLHKDAFFAVETMERMGSVRRKEKNLLQVILEKIADTDAAVALSHVTRALRRIAGYSVAIADDAMNRTLTPKP